MTPRTPSPAQVWLRTGLFAGWAQNGACSMCRAGDVPTVWAGSVAGFGRSRAVHACVPCMTTLIRFVHGEAASPCGPTRYGAGFVRLRRFGPHPKGRGRAAAGVVVLGLFVALLGVAGAR
ncbi:hypothetical protein GCM10009757_01890 [Streptomyces cheonanensis]|uniref:Uncharacterized protein n=3 Tax=Streptomyces TaxID=1883 RepID=A0A1I6UR26_9ACTN|nr:hypothetical protein SAMN05444716_10699 [Streptomyces harbinensis]